MKQSKICKYCNINFIIKRKGNEFCSRKCVIDFYALEKKNNPKIFLTQEEFDKLSLSVTKDNFDKLWFDDYIQLQCKFCKKEYQQTKRLICRSVKQYGYSGYCSRGCCNKEKHKNNSLTIFCTECGKELKRCLSRIKSCENSFCSRKCAAKHRNKNNKIVVRRSKIEEFIENKIKGCYPNLLLICNERELLAGLELDFYFPDLKLAFELNGITHYEPIYGVDRLTRSKDSDKRKMISCFEKGIELAVINISSIKYFKEKYGNEVFEEFKKIINPLVQ